MRLLIVAAVMSALGAMPALAQTASGPPPITGLLKSFDGKTLSLTAHNGQTSNILLTPATRIFLTVPRTLADIKPGDFIASAGTRGADGVLRANEIRIFSAPGQRRSISDDQAGPDNDQCYCQAGHHRVATAKQISGGQTTVIKLAFHGADPPGSLERTGPRGRCAKRSRQGLLSARPSLNFLSNVPVVCAVCRRSRQC